MQATVWTDSLNSENKIIILNIFISWYDHCKTDVHSETFQNLR